MSTNQKSLLRQWHMLRQVPRAPAMITVAQLCERLADADYKVTPRTVQRDLKELMEVFPLQPNEESKPFGWSWMRDGAAFSLPGVTVPEALALTLLQQQLGHQLPPDTAAALQSHFAAAARTLGTVGDQVPSKAWLGKVRSIAAAQPLLPPVIDAGVRDVVYGALMADRQLTLAYRKRDVAQPAEYPVVHPLAVVQRGAVIYLVCMFADYADVRTLALHRIAHAVARMEPARKPAGFDLDDYVASGQFGVVAGAPMRLRAVFTRQAGEHLYETPLCSAQQLEALPGGGLQLRATVPNTRALVWWLLGFGDGVVVHEPAALRAEIADMARNMAHAYGQSQPV